MIQLQTQAEQSPTQARLEFGGSPITAPTWQWSVYPDAPLTIRQTTTATLVSSMIYDVTLPSGTFVYLWVTVGASTYGPFAIDALAESDPRMVQIGNGLRDRLLLNLPELNYAIRDHVPDKNQIIRVIGYKMDLDEGEPPWMVIGKGRKTPSLAGTSNLLDNMYEFTIVFAITVSDEPEDRTPAASALMDTLTDILNRSYYRTMVIHPGCSVGDCRAMRGVAEMNSTTVTNGYRYYAMGTVVWQARLFTTEP